MSKAGREENSYLLFVDPPSSYQEASLQDGGIHQQRD